MQYFYTGIKWTILISLLSVLFGVIFGALLTLMKRSKFKIGKVKPLSIVATAYIEIIRGTPMLLQIMLVYYGFDQLLNINMDPLAAGIIAVSLNSAAYVSEIIRAGIDAVDKGQLEAARSLGMNQFMAMKLIIIPQATKNILPAIGNEFVTVIKESSMASVIGVGEIMYSAKVITGKTFRAFEPLIVAAVFYFVITFTLGRVMNYIERRMKASDSR
ncbi:amino acid ABC transporter permease [Clostridium tertium]|uniref:amino acid ABC transporter permease n=1 Tax=Clostridium tertium TaxID=1559 RepID=UPI000DCFB607|nr:amino acid ABC transporter permease [Clostridium tertium]MBU6134152.1 amino acid ABC transporter permease [Clostridium tertium]MDB1946466.1 amino acid ABC transporter permease [Clostridium tertium]